VSNAADEKQVKEFVDRDRATRENELLDLVDVLKTPQGRRLMWRIMAWCGNEGTPKRATDELTYMAIGSGDVGRWLKSEVVEAGEDLLFQMMRENMENNGGKDARRKN
jgi:hypothetical protein